MFPTSHRRQKMAAPAIAISFTVLLSSQELSSLAIPSYFALFFFLSREGQKTFRIMRREGGREGGRADVRSPSPTFLVPRRIWTEEEIGTEKRGSRKDQTSAEIR